MIRFIKDLYLQPRLFYVIFGLATWFLLSFLWHGLYPLGILMSYVLAVLCLIEISALFGKKGIRAQRNLPEKFSNSDWNPIPFEIENTYGFDTSLKIIDEIPVQFQKRDFRIKMKVKAHQKIRNEYTLKPLERGVYVFGKLHVFATTKIGFISRRFSFDDQQEVKVYPSFIQMQKYDFLAIDNRISQIGLKKVRRIGHTMEFEQIKDYVRGDDIRTINWKATAKRGNLMVNQYQDEKSQPIYSVINTGRQMKMPFEGLKLLDYAINSCLAFSNIALKKNDKAGLLTYDAKIDNFLLAQSRRSHLQRILQTLYNIDTEFLDTDIGLLYAHIKRKINQRSLILLYTNFEHISSMRRQLPYFKAIAKKHLLVVIFFENTELKTLVESEVENLSDIYDQTIAIELYNNKKKMAEELRRNGIQTVLTTPQNLSLATINKYLELKARGIL